MTARDGALVEGATAWSKGITGYLAGVFFAFICQRASNKTSSDVKKETLNILIWSAITFCVRVLDILLLSGAVKIEAIYHTPTGPTLYANIVSEIIIAFPYTALALVGSALLLRCLEDQSKGVELPELPA